MADESPAMLYRAFVAQDPAAAIKVVEGARSSGIAQADLFDAVFAPALALLGAAWSAGDVDETAFVQASVVAEQVSSFVIPSAAAADTGVTVVAGVTHRDRHSIMKNIVVAALKEAGNRVVDIGSGARAADFLEKVDETGARIAIVFAEMVQTARSCAAVRAVLAAGGHDDVVILVCGGPFEADTALAKEVGANGVVHGAESAIRLVGRIVAERSGPRGSA